MKDRELDARVIRFIREIGIAPERKVQTVGFDLTRGVAGNHLRSPVASA